jgi:TRAP-type C4-dicarboxylate transport system permease large subunit
VIQGLTGETIGRVARAALPFFIIMFIMAMLIALVPDIVMFLPNAIKLRG